MKAKAKKKKLQSKKTKKISKKRWTIKLEPETRSGIFIVVFLSLTIISILSYFHQAGILGDYFYRLFNFLFGRGYFLIPLGLLYLTVSFWQTRHKALEYSFFLGLGLFVISFLVLLFFLLPEGQNAGGYLGFLLGAPLKKLLGFWAGLVLIFAGLIIGVLLMFNLRLRLRKQLLSQVSSSESVLSIEKKEKPNLEIKFSEEAKETYKQPEEIKKESLWSKGKKFLEEKIPKSRSDEIKVNHTQISLEESTKKGESIELIPCVSPKKKAFKLPPLSLLERDKGQPTSGDIKANINIIRRTLQNFGIEVEMAEVNVGPTVTQYTLRPAEGIKLSRITALQNDLSLALAAHPIRIEAPIPGRSLVGIEIPNKSVILVRLGNLLKSVTFRESPSPLTVALGRDVAGNPVYADLSRMPHLLIAGATGTGKTIGLNSLIVSLLYRNSPETLRLVLIDPKRVEFHFYNDIPHLLTPVITQADKAVNALRWAIGEMEERFSLLEEAGARDIFSYNHKVIKNGGEVLPFIVIIIDELADLMAARGREMEAGIVRLAQMARAVGIHLIVATQRPSVEVITGLIKANITSRIAFQVASQIDSRTILDTAGAEKLLGNGDMLYLASDFPKPRRVQGAYISEREVRRVTSYLKKLQKPQYDDELLVPQKVEIPGFSRDIDEEDDELYERAREVVIEAGKASASFLQRRLRVGYSRAARLIDLLEKRGVVGPADGSKPREVLVSQEEIQSQEFE